MAGMGNSWIMVLEHAVAVIIEAASAIYVALRIRDSAAAVGGVASDIATTQMPRLVGAMKALAQGDLNVRSAVRECPPHGRHVG
jgi:hypothetical protein